jgi:hypothetical protein
MLQKYTGIGDEINNSQRGLESSMENAYTTKG